MDARPHLLVVATNYVETTGGVEGHLQRLLPLLVERGVAVTVAYLGSRREPYTDAHGVHVVALARQLDFREIMALPSPRSWQRFARDVRLGRLPGGPVTHVSTQTRFFPTSWLGMRLGHALRVPVVHTEHGGGYVATSSRLVEAAAKAVDHTVGRQVLRGADRVLAVSQASCDFVRRLSGVAASPFNNGVDIARWLPPAGESGPAERSLVFVGRMVPEKGWRAFLRAAKACRDDGFTGPIALLGDGSELMDARRRASDLGLPDARIPGRVTAEVVRDHLRGGVLVNPTTASEGFQLTLVEAMAAGAAIVSYAVGGTAEVSRVPGADVSVVPLGDEDGLIRATKEALRRPAPSPDRRTLEQWDWAKVADAYVAVLADVAT